MPTQEDIVQALGNMNVMQLIDLTKTLEDKWGVLAAPHVALAPAPVGGHIGVPEPAEPTTFSVVLMSAGPNRIPVIKAVREALVLSLLDGKAIVEGSATEPKTIKEGLSKAEAEELKGKLEAAGARVEVK